MIFAQKDPWNIQYAVPWAAAASMQVLASQATTDSLSWLLNLLQVARAILASFETH
jgi:hypothetical protein